MNTLSWTDHIEYLQGYFNNAPHLFNFNEAGYMNRLEERFSQFGYWEVSRSMCASECERLSRMYTRIAPLYKQFKAKQAQAKAEHAKIDARYHAYKAWLKTQPYLVQQYAAKQEAAIAAQYQKK